MEEWAKNVNELEFLRNLAGKQQEINDANSRLEEMARSSATSTAEDPNKLFNVPDARAAATVGPEAMVAANSGGQVGRQIEYNPSIVDKSAPDLNNVKVLDGLVKQMAQEYYGKLEKEGQRFGSPNSATDGATVGNQPAAPQGMSTPDRTAPPSSSGGGSRYYEENTGSPARGVRPSTNSRPAPKKAVGVSAKSGGEAKFKTRPSRVSPNDPTISAGEMRPDGGASSPAPEGYTRDVQLGLVKNSPEVSDETWLQATRMENPIRSIDRQRVLVGPGRSAKPNSKAPASGYYDPAVNKVLRGEAPYSGPEVSPTAPVKPSPSKVQQSYNQSNRRPSDPRAGGAADRSTPQPIKVKQTPAPSGRETALDGPLKEIAAKKSAPKGGALVPAGKKDLVPTKPSQPKQRPERVQGFIESDGPIPAKGQIQKALPKISSSTARAKNKLALSETPTKLKSSGSTIPAKGKTPYVRAKLTPKGKKK